MALEQISEGNWQFSPGPFDVHAHPRVFDVITDDGFVSVNEGREGKAGLKIYTETALRSGIVALAAMPNESVRRYDISAPDKTEEVPYPIASLDRVLAMQAAISHEARIPAGIYMGLDPQTAFRDMDKQRINRGLLHKEFTKVADECLGLKVYLAPTTGGNNIAAKHAAYVTEIWRQTNPGKPVIFHAEGEDVAQVLYDISKLKDGNDIPVHIAHVSSRQELQAVIEAKRAGMNATCEVTPHHLFLDEAARAEIGGYGCMKPSLKSPEDVDFLWAHMKDIDIFASDCAPHRISDKEKSQPAFGVTNHTLMLPLLLGAVADECLSMEDIYQKFCVTPRERFNLPLNDGSRTEVSAMQQSYTQEDSHRAAYGQDPFVRLSQKFHLRGQVTRVQAGRSARYADGDMVTEASYTHLIRPKNLGLTVVSASERF